MSIKSSLLLGTLSKYRVAIDENTKRFRNLANFLGIDIFPGGTEEGSGQEKEAAKESESLSKAERDWAANRFKDLLDDDLPPSFFWHEKNEQLANNILPMMYKAIEDKLPRYLSKALQDKKVGDPEERKKIVSKINAEISDPQKLKDIAMDILDYFEKNTDLVSDGLARVFHTKGETPTDDEDTRQLGLAQAFFQPRIGDSLFREILKDPTRYDVDEAELKRLSPRSLDRSTLDSLVGMKGKEIKWKWESGPDENDILTFTLPELYGNDRKFSIKTPPSISNIRKGTYTFKIRGGNNRGVILEFVDQKDEARSKAKENLESTGITSQQLQSFIYNNFIDKYLSNKYYTNFISTINREFGIPLTPDGSVTDETLAELGEGDEEDRKQTRGEEKVRGKYEEEVAEVKKQVQRLLDTHGRVVGDYLLNLGSEPGQSIAKVVAAQFPTKSTKATPSLQDILTTRPVVELAVQTIMDPRVPPSAGKSSPWRFIFLDRLADLATSNASVREDITDLILHQQMKPKGSKKFSFEDFMFDFGDVELPSTKAEKKREQEQKKKLEQKAQPSPTPSPAPKAPEVPKPSPGAAPAQPGRPATPTPGAPAAPAAPAKPGAPSVPKEKDRSRYDIPERRNITDEVIRKFIKSIEPTKSPFQSYFRNLQSSIAEEMQNLKDHPALTKFYDRLKVWGDYKGKLSDDIAAALVDQKIDPDSPKAKKFIESQIKNFVDKGYIKKRAPKKLREEAPLTQEQEEKFDERLEEKYNKTAFDLAVHSAFRKFRRRVTL